VGGSIEVGLCETVDGRFDLVARTKWRGGCHGKEDRADRLVDNKTIIAYCAYGITDT
jgi:hypothetical protein